MSTGHDNPENRRTPEGKQLPGAAPLPRREFLLQLKKWSPAVGTLFLGVTTLLIPNAGCFYDEYNRYSRYEEYCNITYCNGPGQNYRAPGGVCYCNYFDYTDGV